MQQQLATPARVAAGPRRLTTPTAALLLLPRCCSCRCCPPTWREEPRDRALPRHFLASVTASWLLITSHSPSEAITSTSSSACRVTMVTCPGGGQQGRAAGAGAAGTGQQQAAQRGQWVAA